MYNVVIIVDYCTSLSIMIICSAGKLRLVVCVTVGVCEFCFTRVATEVVLHSVVRL